MSIEVKDLYFSYGKGKSRKNILNNINFSVNKGKVFGIVGNVGSGKTTLIKHLNGLLLPTSGSVRVDGLSSSKKEICKNVGVLFQHPSKQLFCKTVFEDIAYGPSNFGIKGAELENCVHEAIKKVGLDTSILKRSPFDLSGGEMRLVALAGVLSSSPDYLILDEPTSGLNSYYKDQLYNIISQLKKSGVCIVLVSHHIDDILDISDDLIHLGTGTISFMGSPVDYLSSQSMPVPHITLLMRQLRSEFVGINENVFSVDDAFNEIVSNIVKRG